MCPHWLKRRTLSVRTFAVIEGEAWGGRELKFPAHQKAIFDKVPAVVLIVILSLDKPEKASSYCKMYSGV